MLTRTGVRPVAAPATPAARVLLGNPFHDTPPVTHPKPFNIHQAMVVVRVEWESLQQLLREGRDMSPTDVINQMRAAACALLTAADDYASHHS